MAMTKEYIEREEVMQAFSDFVWNSNHSDLVPAPQWNHAVDIVRDYPAADVVPVRHGRWAQTGYDHGLKVCECYVNGCLTEYQKRPDDCPLVPVPPHGRLIDADALDKQIYNDIPLKVFGNIARMAEMRNIVYHAPTIIEAEEGE